MSNETDLDWLARTEHHWPKGAVYVSRHENAVEWHYVELAFKCRGHFTHDQWLARRAELQNKPSWADAPEWAEWLAQDDSGYWYWYASKPTHPGMKSWWPVPGANNVQCGKGEVLCDWRDTLERRPEPTRAEMEVEFVKAAFKPFISIEDNQEFNVSNKQEVKQGNGWFERGDRPPLGRCLVKHKSATTEWAQPDFHEKNIVAAGDFLLIFRSDSGQETVGEWDDYEFRPIRTEREQLTSIIDGGKRVLAEPEAIADAILAAGFSLRAK